LAWRVKDWQLSGNKKAAPKNYGNTKYKVLEKAPGSYVKEKAID
jgi:polyhydroxyalkanoate synthase